MVVIIVFYEVELGTPAPRVDKKIREEEKKGMGQVLMFVIHQRYYHKVLMI